MSPGAVLGEAWAMYRTHWRHLLPIALVVYLLLSLFVLLLTALAGVVGAVIGGLVNLAGVFWLQGAMVVAIEDVRDGRADLSIRDTLSRVRPRMNTLALAGILATIAIIIGLFGLVIGALVVFTFLFAIVPVIMLEGAGVFRSFGRSRELVSGNFWSVFGLVVLTILILIGAGIVIGIVLSPFPDEVEGYVGNVISNALTAPFLALALTLAYYRLRDAREPAAAVTPAV